MHKSKSKSTTDLQRAALATFSKPSSEQGGGSSRLKVSSLPHVPSSTALSVLWCGGDNDSDPAAKSVRQQARKQLRRYSLWCTKLAMTVTRGVTNVSAGRQVLYALAALLALGLTAGIVGVLRVGSDGNAGQVGGGAALQP